MAGFSLFIPITKVDEEKRLVYGAIAVQELDNSGEMFDYASSKPLFEKWSNGQYEASGGLSKGNVRAMHGSIAAGKLTEIEFNDSAETIEGCAKVVDDNEWNKVIEGVYTGFSMGGKYAKRWTEDGIRKYTADPCEVSLVDKPCIKSATFAMIKADGTIEEVLYKAAKGDDDEEKYGDVEYADTGYQSDGKKRYPVDTEEHIRSAWSYINQEKNASKYSAADLKKVKAKIVSAWKSKIDKDGPPSAAKKSDNGDAIMYVPTNDEILPRAQALAKAAGKTDADWLGFVDPATAELVAEHETPPVEKAAKPDHTDEDCKAGDDCEKCAAMKAAKVDTGADTVAEGNLEQVWQAKDGKTFSKKADAIAHNEQLAKAEAPKAPLLGALDALQAAVTKVEGGEPAEEEPAPVEGEALEVRAEKATKMADFLSHPDVLAKGLYEVSRMSDALRSVASLYLTVKSEAAKEGDGSTVPATILTGIGTLGDALIAMASEEVGEVMERLREKDAAAGAEVAADAYCYPEVYVALAHDTMGLEKADAVEFFNKAVEISSKDKKRVQAIHDHSVSMGANCGGDETAEKMAKADSALVENETLRKQLGDATSQIEAAMPQIEKLVKQVETLMNRPQPPAPKTHVISKGDDTGTGAPAASSGDPATVIEGLIKTHGADMVSMALIKHAQANPQRLGGVAS